MLNATERKKSIHIKTKFRNETHHKFLVFFFSISVVDFFLDNISDAHVIYYLRACTIFFEERGDRGCVTTNMTENQKKKYHISLF